ncbi:MAG TPA: inositol monophosphatase [Verrucomicrobiae bacterium]|nr:inositol monophosphatase [Verrucomicrobiae bacterium]
MNKEYLDFATSLAHQAGDIMLAHFQFGVSYERKADKTHLTIADTAINKMVVDKVASTFPEHRVLGEEESSVANDSEFVWVCDPIDGTTSYVFGLATNVFSLVLVHKGIPLLGVVYDPHMKRLFTAEKGQGAYMNGERLRVNSLTVEESVIGCTGKRSKTVDSAGLHAAIERTAHRMMFLGCVVYEGMLTAAGHMGGHVYSGSNPYDGVASALFVKEAGGKVTNLLGEDQKYDREIKGIVATNGVVHDDILRLVQKSLLQK